MPGDRNRFTEQWDAVDPFDQKYPHLWIKVEHLGRYLLARNVLKAGECRRVADIGCGTGYGSKLLAASAELVFAIDENSDAISRLAGEQVPRIRPVEMRLGTDHLLDLTAEPLDAIVCFETLEHLIDPGNLLRQCRDVLRPGGLLLASVPNSVAERVDDTGLLTNQLHRRVFSISSIRELVEDSGFQVREILGQPLAADIHRNETRLIKRKQLDGRTGDEHAFHEQQTLERLAMTIGYPEQRDVERSYSIVIIAERISDK